MQLVVLLLGAVSNELETADHLANREETNNFSSHDTSGDPLLLGESPYAVEDVDGLCGA